jgi:photosystem II stability/assembly factor-like uncharacterized protein
LLETTDGGETWLPVPAIRSPEFAGICGLWGVTEKVVYGVGAYWGVPRVFKTTDAGRVWQVFDLSSLASGLVDCCFLTSESGVVVGTLEEPNVGRRAVILTTSDGGVSWERSYMSALHPLNYGWKVSFPSEKIGFAAVECSSPDGTILKTTDLGRSWGTGAHQFTDLQGIGFATDELGWAGGWGRPCVETTDGGQSWHSPSFGWNVNSFCMFGDSLGYAVGQRIHRYRPGYGEPERESASADDPVRRDATLRSWAFPNPFAGGTHISYLLTRPQLVDVSVFAVTGTKLAGLYSGPQVSGEHVIHWDGRSTDGQPLPNGVYYYKVETQSVRESGTIQIVR